MSYLTEMNQDFELIAKTFQGLEDVLAKELTELGADNIEIGRRMVSFSGDKKMMYESLVKLETTEYDRVFSGHGKDSNHEMQMRNIQVYKKFLTR